MPNTLIKSGKKIAKGIIYPLYEKRIERLLKGKPIPNHIGVILDGNRRWSRENPDPSGDTSSSRGHRAGANKIVELLEWSEKAGVKVVTLWLLSNQNLSRDKNELEPLLEIIESTISGLAKAGKWEIRPVGSINLLPEKLQNTLNQTAASTSGIGKLLVNVAVGYGGRDEIADAFRGYLNDPQNQNQTGVQLARNFDASQIEKYLYTAGLPDPDLLIRTSGEQRLGGFLLWQSANSEVYFCEAFWPDFRHLDFLRAMRSFAQRQRRYGL